MSFRNRIGVWAAVAACSAGLAVGAPIGFVENFDGPALDPKWMIDPGIGSFSLTDRPGYLRYNTTTSTHPSGDAPGVKLYRQFSGTEWTMSARVEYEMGPGNGRQIFTRIIFDDLGDRLVNEVFWFRTKDDFGGAVPPEGRFEFGAYDSASLTPGTPGPVNPGDDYFVRVIRSGQSLKIFFSDDGLLFSLAFQHVFAAPLPPDQIISISGATFASGQLARGDFDYINVTGVPEPGSLMLMFSGLGYLVLRRKGRH